MATAPGSLTTADRPTEVVPESVLLPYQQRWIADHSQVKVCEKSRRIGLSWAEAADAALTAASASGMDVYYMAYSLDMTAQFIKDVAFWARAYALACGEMEEFEEVYFEGEERKSVKVYQVKFASGHVVQALSSHPRGLRSKKGRAIFDEFAFTDAPDELLKAGLAFLIWGGDLRVISTHNGVDHPFNRLIEECRAGKKPYKVHKIDFETAVSEGLFQRICLMRGKPWSQEDEETWEAEIRAFYGDGAEEELDCVPKASAGKYFSRTLIERATSKDAPVVRLSLKAEFLQLPEPERVRQIEDWCADHLRPLLRALDPHLKSIIGQDFGRVADLTVILPAQIGRDLVRRVPFAIELRNVPFEAQKQILFYVIDRLPKFVASAHDAGGNGAYLAEVAAQRYGLMRVHQVKLSPAWYLDGFPRYKSGLEDGHVVLPADADIVDDHLDVERVSGVPLVPKDKKRKASADGMPRHGDAAIAAVLMWYASLHQGAPIDFEASAPRTMNRLGDDFAGAGRGIRDDVGFGAVGGLDSFFGF